MIAEEEESDLSKKRDTVPLRTLFGSQSSEWVVQSTVGGVVKIE